MSVFYLGKIRPPEGVEVEKLPPSVALSDWFSNILSVIETQGEFNGDYLTGYIKMTFDNQTDLETWLTTNALSDPTLINDVKVWNETYGIVHVNEIHNADGSVTATNLSLIPLE